MSIFNSIDSESIVPVIEGYGAEVGGAVAAVTESYQDQLAIIKSIHTMDVGEAEASLEAANYAEGSTEHSAVVEQYAAVYEAASSTVFEKIKAFFVNLSKKVKAFFAAVRRRFELIFKDTEAFVTKHESDLKKLNLSGMKATMFDYTVEDNNRAQQVVDAVDTTVAKHLSVVRGGGNLSKEQIASARTELEKAIENVKSEARSKISGSSTKDMNDSEYSAALFSLFRGGAKGKEDKQEKSVNIDALIASAKGSSKLLGVIDKAKASSDKRYSDLIKAADEAGKKAKGEMERLPNMASNEVKGVGHVRRDAVDGAVSLLQKISNITGMIQGIESKYYEAWKTAVEERNREYKSVIGRALHFKAA